LGLLVEICFVSQVTNLTGKVNPRKENEDQIVTELQEAKKGRTVEDE